MDNYIVPDPTGSDDKLPIGSALIAQFQYLIDCIIKIPVAIKEKNGTYYLKTPIQPKPEWNIPFYITGFDFPVDFEIRLYREITGEISYWQTRILRKIAKSDNSEIFEVAEPMYFGGQNKRQFKRFYAITPVMCTIGDNTQPIKATCMDISEQGLGIKIAAQITFPEKTKFTVQFRKFKDVPEITGVMMRQHYNSLDGTTTFGLLVEEKSRHHLPGLIQMVIDKQVSDSFNPFHETANRATQSNTTRLFGLFD